MFHKPWEPQPHADTVTDLLARPPSVGNHPCVRAGCASAVTWRCNYRDTTGDRCDTFVCPEHGHAVAEVLFCARHARVVELLLRTEGSLFEIKGIPTVGDRSLVLVDEVGQLVEEPILGLLRRRYEARPEVRIAADLGVRPFGRGRRPLGWERGWSAVAEQGFQSRVTLRVYSGRPRTVYALLDDLPVFQGVPSWVRAEDRRPRTSRAESGFRDALLEAIENELFSSPSTD